MDKLIFVPTVVLSFILVPIYLINCRRRSQPHSLSVVVHIVLSAAGVIGGGLLLVRPLFPSVARLAGLDIYIWLGALVVLIVSGEVIFREIFKGR